MIHLIYDKWLPCVDAFNPSTGEAEASVSSRPVSYSVRFFLEREWEIDKEHRMCERGLLALGWNLGRHPGSMLLK